MEEGSKFHVGLDGHKDSISIAAAELGRTHARLVGKVTHDLSKLMKVLNKIGSAEQLHIEIAGRQFRIFIPRGFNTLRRRCDPHLVSPSASLMDELSPPVRSPHSCKAVSLSQE